MTSKTGLATAIAVLVTVVAAPAATAGARTSTIKGVVVARQAARGTLVVASAGGRVSTIRTGAHRTLGSRITAKATRLSDGTFKASAIGGRSVARSARIHATVVRAAAGRLVLSAGGSVFAIRGFRQTSAVGSSLDPGSVVNATLTIDPGEDSITQAVVQDVGQSNLVSLEGSISSLAPGSLVVAVEEGALTTIAIPSSITLPSTVAVGDRVELIAQVANGAFTLVTIQDEHAVQASGEGANIAQSEVEAEGFVTALSPTSLTIQGEQATPITFAIPAGFTMPTVQVGDRVHAKGTMASDGTITLTRLETQGHEGDNGQAAEVEAEGAVTAVSSTSLSVQASEGGAVVVFTVPTGFDVSAVKVGDSVEAKGTRASDGTVTLTKLEVRSGDSGSGDSASGSTSGSGDSGSGSGSTSGSGDSGDGGNG